MFGVRILSVATAYAVIILEMYSGVINGPLWWVAPGALVLALLTAVSLVVDQQAQQPQGFLANAVQWIVIIITALAMSFFANYFGRELIPDLVANRVTP